MKWGILTSLSRSVTSIVWFFDKYKNNNLSIRPYGFIDGIYYNKILDAYNRIVNDNETKKSKLFTAARNIILFETEFGYCPLINTDEFRIITGV